MKKILVTGGCGYIGSHTIVDLLETGYTVLSADDNSRSKAEVVEGIKKITGTEVKNYKVDLRCYEDTRAVFAEHPDISGIIHFAAFKSVEESVKQPLLYFDNNINSLINILRCAAEFNVANFVFSSSCTVYGSPEKIPVTEESPLQPAQSPYGSTKQIGEEIILQSLRANEKMKATLLRYFNPAGAHPSNLIGEDPRDEPQNLVPRITQAAAGRLPEISVWGTDYDTRDGSCIRDYIHVCDIAHAHTLALQYLEKETTPASTVFNLGSGNGVTVLEIIKAFEAVTNKSLNYKTGPRRAGDVEAIYADNKKACSMLNWTLKYDLNDIMQTAWQRELAHIKLQNIFPGNAADLN